jgi:hypothetical protein
MAALRVLLRWLSEIDRARVVAACGAAAGWQRGRLGTGYEKVDIKQLEPLHALVRAALVEIGADPSEDKFWDAYLLRYETGAHAPPHRDPCEEPARRHVRLNAVAKASTSGGDLVIAGQPIRLAEGDAVVFHPDDEEHSVWACEGERLVFSVGAWIQRLVI